MGTVVKPIELKDGKFSVVYKNGPREIYITKTFDTLEDAKVFAKESADKEGFIYTE